ncbi:unnamed protein product [Rhizoctonia solani]|uniref:Uncharacterized protein n=1 Tax=Rhizoctonia solani TaxID=456999 RepID=A0A8H3BFS1_9AGAM|nr:unnamed protein product [Rhizoctonia solani]
MASANPTSGQKQALGWDYHRLFTCFCELASTPKHSAFAGIPPATSFTQTQCLLQSEKKQKVWMKESMMGGIEMLTEALDQDWPDWAANSTNVLGLILSDLFILYCGLNDNVQPSAIAAYVGMVAWSPPDDTLCMFPTFGDWEKREGGDADASGELED